jgi:hypothetical protein
VLLHRHLFHLQQQTQTAQSGACQQR